MGTRDAEAFCSKLNELERTVFQAVGLLRFQQLHNGIMHVVRVPRPSIIGEMTWILNLPKLNFYLRKREFGPLKSGRKFQGSRWHVRSIGKSLTLNIHTGNPGGLYHISFNELSEIDFEFLQGIFSYKIG